jgi:hypothetical protein
MAAPSEVKGANHEAQEHSDNIFSVCIYWHSVCGVGRLETTICRGM